MPKYKSVNKRWVPINDSAKETDLTLNLQKDGLLTKNFQPTRKKKEESQDA